MLIKEIYALDTDIFPYRSLVIDRLLSAELFDKKTRFLSLGLYRLIRLMKNSFVKNKIIL